MNSTPMVIHDTPPAVPCWSFINAMTWGAVR